MSRNETNAKIYLSDNVINILKEIAKGTEALTGDPFDLQDMLNACFDQGVCYYLQHYKIEEFKQVRCASQIN